MAPSASRKRRQWRPTVWCAKELAPNRRSKARLAIADGGTVWSMKEVEDVERARVAILLDLGFSVRDIAEGTGLHRSKVHRLKQRIEAQATEVDLDRAVDVVGDPATSVGQ